MIWWQAKQLHDTYCFSLTTGRWGGEIYG